MSSSEQLLEQLGHVAAYLLSLSLSVVFVLFAFHLDSDWTWSLEVTISSPHAKWGITALELQKQCQGKVLCNFKKSSSWRAAGVSFSMERYKITN